MTSIEDEDNIQQIQDTSESDSKTDCNGIGLCYHSINVISSTDKQFFLELIDKIENLEIKTEYLLKLKDVVL